jgi:hypothetical protein
MKQSLLFFARWNFELLTTAEDDRQGWRQM